MPPADFRILLSHSPDLFYKAQGWAVDLMLAGHNHGGQIRLPLVGPVFMPSRYSRRFDRSFFRQNGTLMHVSDGVGGKHPVRYGCPPEVSRMVLRVAAGTRELIGNSVFQREVTSPRAGLRQRVMISAAGTVCYSVRERITATSVP